MAKRDSQEYIGLFIPKSMGVALAKMAIQLDTDRSKIVRQAINLWLRKNPKVKA